MKNCKAESAEMETSCEFFRSYVTSPVALMGLQSEVVLKYQGFPPSVISFTQRLFEAYNFLSTHSNAEMQSEDMFQYWRNLSFSTVGVVTTIALTLGIEIAQNILISPEFARIMDISNCYGSLVMNDIFGISRHIKNGDEGNVFTYKFYQKGIPFEIAVDEVCQKFAGNSF